MYCHECVNLWVAAAASTGTPPVCPACRGAMQLARSRMVDSMVRKLRVRCPRSSAVGRSAKRQRTGDAVGNAAPATVGAAADAATAMDPAACGWEGTLSELEAHTDVCPLEPVPCPHPGCKESVRRSQMAGHDASCPHRFTVCRHPGCRKLVLTTELSQHAETCEHRTYPCRHGCLRGLKQSEAAAHEPLWA